MRRLLTVSWFAFAAVAAFASGELENAVLHGETDKERATEYKPGETMTFTLRLQGAKALPPDTYFIAWTRSGDDGKIEKGFAPASLTEPLVVKTKIDKPGFVRLLAIVTDSKKHAYAKKNGKDKRVFFDGGAGVEIEKLQSVPEPADFDAFWAAQRARLAAVPMTAERKELQGSDSKRLYAVRIACAGGKPVTGYLSIPKDAGNGKKYPARLETHGYSFRPPYNPPRMREGEIVLNINAHGVDLPAFGANEAYYKDFGKSIKSNGKGYALDPVQNSDREAAYFNGMALRVMRGLEYLKSLPEWNGRDLYASGGSQGGLQTIWAAGLDPQVTKAESSITWCCDMGGRKTLKRNLPTWGVSETEAMRYYDPVNIARRISKNCRTLIPRAGLGDYTCPPSGLAILFNNIPGPKKINWVQGSTHGYVPPEKHQEFSQTGNGWQD